MIQAFKYLFSVIKWRITPNKFRGRSIIYKGRTREIIGESFQWLVIKGVKKPVHKNDLYITNFSGELLIPR